MSSGNVTSDKEWFKDKLDFDRETIRRSEEFIEKDFRGVHPRELLRKSRRKIQDISRKDDELKFEIKQDPIEVSDEEVGDGSGYVRGGLKAHFERPDHDGGLIEYSPYRQHGIWTIIGGGILFGLSAHMENGPLSIVSMMALIVGGYAFTYSEYETFNVQIISKLRSLIVGEVSEEKIEEEDKTITNVKGNVAMMFAADTDVELLAPHKYRKILDKPDVKNTDALVNEIEKLQDEIYQDIYLNKRQKIPEPIPKHKVRDLDRGELEAILREHYSKERINRWITQKLKEKSVVQEHVVEESKQDLRKVKNEAIDLAATIEDYVEK